MRMTKFRGYSKRLNKWVYGDLVDGNVIVNGIVEMNADYIAIESWEGVVPESVGQYADFKDNSETEIYEDDIVDVFNLLTVPNHIQTDVVRGVVVFLEGAWLVENVSGKIAIPLFSETNRIKVVGNVYENKEFLEGE